MKLFEVKTPLGTTIRTTVAYWKKITVFKHPSIAGKEGEAKATLSSPEAVRQSVSDPSVLLYYKRFGEYYVCVVVKILNGDGFIITAYKTENMKEGELVWPT
jgi:hypothetical protein